MNDPYRIAEKETSAPSGMLRPLLWLGLVLSAAVNVVVSSVGGSPFVGSGFGAVALVCAVALIIRHYRTKPR
jgi:hypothetical protein